MRTLLLILLFLVSFTFTWSAEKPKPRYGIYWAGTVVAADASAPDGELSLRAFPEQSSPGIPVILSNRTGKTVKMLGCDGALFIVEEARDAEGRWRPIEPYPTSRCDNSYFNMALKSGDAWILKGVRHSGSFKTLLRFKLEGKTPIYSNEFEGSIDPSQFNISQSNLELDDLLLEVR